ncbi:MAG: DUF4855 domain-containing protein [Bacteroidales bacterium]|nr:DUF4855 domain-containing protein [Bacteroidales bacterium]
MKHILSNIIAVVSTAMIFSSCGTPKNLYRWEKDEIRPLADAAICYGGHSARDPYLWTEERFEKTVLYKDENGQEHWLFDNMIMMELWDDDYAVTFSIANDGRYSSRKEHWLRQLDYWFDEENGFAALDRCIDAAAKRIGNPPSKRGIIFSLPDPVYFEHYTNAMKGENRNTVYWGEIGAVAMDFSKSQDRIQAYLWLVDAVRTKFAQAGYRHIELIGFYVLSEELSVPGSFRYEYKEHDVTIKAVADYCHSMNEGFYWVPYAMAPGIENSQDFGFDLVVMQPNYYWTDAKWTWDQIEKKIRDFGLGMELEFEGTHGEPLTSSILSNLKDGRPNPYSERNKARFQEYLDNARSRGLYGQVPFVLYAGTNGLYELAVSQDEKDKEIYHKLCKFVVGNPLKNQPLSF